jgi:hypothetical protein
MTWPRCFNAREQVKQYTWLGWPSPQQSDIQSITILQMNIYSLLQVSIL